MTQKKLMLLGGLRYLKPVIDAAHKQGCYVITADNLPNNIAHKWSDEYCNVSIVDKEAVLQEAKRLKINGIMSFACDPGVVAASYVQNKMGLPSFGPFESVELLQNKDRFRAFLNKHGFNVPQSWGFASVDEAIRLINEYPWPLIVKPTDSAGSKGVKRADKPEDLRPALEYAIQHSLSGRVIVEEYIEKRGCSSDADCMSIDGHLVYSGFNSQYFDEQAINPYTPSAYSWPSSFTVAQESYLRGEIQRLISLLGFRTSVFNVETRIGVDDKPYIMEFTPRGGGNRLCEMAHYISGIDMITAITRAVVGDMIDDSIEKQPSDGYWAEIILHSDREGIFQSVEVEDNLPAVIIEKDVWVKCGDIIHSFSGANETIGTIILRFGDLKTMEHYITHINDWLKVVVS